MKKMKGNREFLLQIVQFLLEICVDFFNTAEVNVKKCQLCGQCEFILSNSVVFNVFPTNG